MARQIKKEHRELIQEVLLANGWFSDRWGNLNKVVDGKKHRIKFLDRSVRFEQKNEQYNMWVNIRSDYYKNILVEDGQVKVMDLVVC